MVVTTPRTDKHGKLDGSDKALSSTAASSFSSASNTLPPLGTLRPATTGCEGTVWEAPNMGAARLPVLDFAAKDAKALSSTARFCAQCGSALIPGGRFCTGCGISLAALADLLLTSARSAPGDAQATAAKQRGAQTARESRERSRAFVPTWPVSNRAAAPASAGKTFPQAAPRSQPSQSPKAQTRAAPREGVLPASPRAASVATGEGPSGVLAVAHEEALEALPQDEVLQSVVQRMTKALIAYFQKRGVHFGIAGNWSTFFTQLDADGSGKVTLEELDSAVRGKLQAQVSRYELRVLFQRVDTNASGLVTMKEFVNLLYRTDLATWPDISAEELEQTVRKLLQAAQRWHNAGGNWFKIFKGVDAEGSGFIAYDEMVKYVRAATGLKLAAGQMPEHYMLGFWKALDSSGKMDVSVHQFMSFCRRCTVGLQMEGVKKLHRREAKRDMPGNRDIAAEIAAVPHVDDEGLTVISKRLAAALSAWLAKRGMHKSSFSTASPKIWVTLFDTVDADHSGRLSFIEFETAVRNLLKVGTKTLSDDDLKAFWRGVDADHSGESTTAEFGRFVYRLQLAEWPVLDSASLERVVAVMNASADKWHRCGGNWYKVFAMAENSVRHSGEMGYDDILRFLREPYPRLQLTRKDISDDEVRALWKSLDSDQSGRVSTKEFTAFMRLHGRALAMHKLTEYTKKQRGLAESQGDLGPVPERSREQLRVASRSLNAALLTYYSQRGIHGNTSTHFDWSKIFREADGDGNGRLTFLELEAVIVRRLAPALRHKSTPQALVPGVSLDDIRALWALVDSNGSGDVTGQEWTLSVYALEVETWPDDENAVQAAVAAMSEAANKWHQAQGNWYRVFNLVDGDNSGTMGFDELREVIYRPLPCLAIPKQLITERHVKALWKALDFNMSSSVSVDEFMLFMRRRDPKSGLTSDRSIPRSGSRLRGAQPKSRGGGTSSVPPSGPFKNTDNAVELGRALAATSHKEFEDAYKSWGLRWQGKVSEWDLHAVVRRLLGIGEERLSDDAIHAAWQDLDRDGTGEVHVDAVLAWGLELSQQDAGR